MSGQEPSITELIEHLRILRIQEARVIDLIERASAREPTAERDNFQIGDRVRITNGVRPGQIPTGVITRVTTERISLTTDDGTRTWRARRNLTRL